jgi:FMN phosphatase YigB (HAD superfamily)
MKYKKVIFDLDDTLIPTHAHPEWEEGNYTHLRFSKNVLSLLRKLGRRNCILLTYDKLGDQRKKLTHLQAGRFFSRMLVVNERQEKKVELQKLDKEYGGILVVGDRYDEGELGYALSLGLDAVCVAFPDGRHRRPEMHHKYSLIIESDKGYGKLLKLLGL